MGWKTTLALVAGWLAVAAPAQGQTVIAGVTVYCSDALGAPVASVPAPGLNDVGMARIEPNGLRVIYLNPGILGQLPPPIQLFWYAHECAHHALGHTLGPPRPTNEIEADCRAIRTGRNQGWFGQQDLYGMYSYFINNPGTSWGHLPGPQRLQLFESCFHS